MEPVPKRRRLSAASVERLAKQERKREWNRAFMEAMTKHLRERCLQIVRTAQLRRNELMYLLSEIPQEEVEGVIKNAFVLVKTAENDFALAEVMGVQPSEPYLCRHPEHFGEAKELFVKLHLKRGESERFIKASAISSETIEESDLDRLLERMRRCNLGICPESYLDSLQDRAEQVQSIKSQLCGLRARKLVKEATEKVIAAEDSLIKCSEAEMPFLKGIEVLPKEESVPALKACDLAIKSALQTESAAALFLQNKMPEVKRLSIEEGPSVDMEKLLKRMKECKEKIESFRKETEQRRASSCLADVMVHMQKAVTASAELKKWAGIYEKGLEVSLEDLRKALEEAQKADKALSLAVAETSQLAREADQSLGPQKKEINDRLSTMTQEAMKYRATATEVSKALIRKEFLDAQQRRIDHLEAQLAHLQEISFSRSEDEQQVIEEQKVMDTLQERLQAALNVAHLLAANAEPTLKTALETILERQRKVDQLFQSIKSQRHARKLVKEATEKVIAAEDSLIKCSEAEMPFLKGIEVLPKEESVPALKACDLAIKSALQTERAAALFLQNKMPEVKHLSTKEGPSVDMEKLLKRMKECKEKIESFRKETEQRRASSCLADVMVHMQKAVAASAEPKKWAGICEKGLEVSLEDLRKALEEAQKADKALSLAVAETSQLAREEAPVKGKGKGGKPKGKASKGETSKRKGKQKAKARG